MCLTERQVPDGTEVTIMLDFLMGLFYKWEW